MSFDPIELSTIEPAAVNLLRSAGITARCEFRPIPGGRNNRVYRVGSGSARVALKWYFWQAKDGRDRLDSEFRFCRFCWDSGIHTVPEPLAADPAHRLGLYEWLPGSRIAMDEVGSRHVNAAIGFVRQLNAHNQQAAHFGLPAAAEACFSIKAHLECVERRVARIAEVDRDASALHQEAEALVRAVLVPAWQQVRAAIEKSALQKDRPIGIEDRCLSPSDFGFHNAVLTDEETIRFLDFEYAGWDDPAKLVSDFFCQVDRPVPRRFWDSFVEGLSPVAGRTDDFRSRCTMLLPVYQIKWACILLNDFLPEHDARRRFSAAGGSPSEGRGDQLQKAREMLERVRER